MHVKKLHILFDINTTYISSPKRCEIERKTQLISDLPVSGGDCSCIPGAGDNERKLIKSYSKRWGLAGKCVKFFVSLGFVLTVRKVVGRDQLFR